MLTKGHHWGLGKLSNPIPVEKVVSANDYLQDEEMPRFLDGLLKEVVVGLFWSITSDGENVRVDIYLAEDISDDLAKELAEFISGQNSDGLGEGFEQQDWGTDSMPSLPWTVKFGMNGLEMTDPPKREPYYDDEEEDEEDDRDEERRQSLADDEEEGDR